MLSLIKIPIKKVSISSCAQLMVMYGPRRPVQIEEKYSIQSRKNVDGFLKASIEIFSRAGYDVLESPSMVCGGLNSTYDDGTLALKVVFYAHENGFGYQKLDVQSSFALPGRKDAYFSELVTLSSGWGFSYSPTSVAEEVMGPIVELLKSAK